MRDHGGGATAPENQFAGQATADWNIALDDLAASLPNIHTVLLVVGWFGSDLRAGSCLVQPKVEVVAKPTTPNLWQVHGVSRGVGDISWETDICTRLSRNPFKVKASDPARGL